MVVPATTGGVPTNPQTTAVCAGYEFTENANHCLKIANTNNAAWPYAATCPTLPNANCLRCDPDGGLWTWPRNPTSVTYFQQSSGGPFTLPNDGQTPMWFGDNFYVFEPSGCGTARVHLEASFYMGITVPAGVFTRFNAEILDNASGGQNGGLGSNFYADVERYAWNENQTQTEYVNASATFTRQLSAGASVQIWANMWAMCGALSTPLASPAQVTYWRLEVCGTMWPNGG